MSLFQEQVCKYLLYLRHTLKN